MLTIVVIVAGIEAVTPTTPLWCCRSGQIKQLHASKAGMCEQRKVVWQVSNVLMLSKLRSSKLSTAEGQTVSETPVTQALLAYFLCTAFPFDVVKLYDWAIQ